MNPSFILSEIERLGIPYKLTSRDILIKCPYHHPDNNPSCSVNIGNTNKPIGIFHCWSCGRHGSWNELAERIGASIIERDEDFYLSVPNVDSSIEIELPYPIHEWKKGWRKLPKSFMEKFEPYGWLDYDSDTYRILFVVKVFGKAVGYVSHLASGDGKPKSKNMPGNWIRKCLFPFDFIVGSYDSVVLVEGVYDALRLIYHGIPAMCTFGTYWNRYRRSLLISGGIRNVVICMDNDKSGRKFSELVYNDINNFFNVKLYDIPSTVVKIDPGNMPLWMLKSLKRIVYSFH